jgi:hypothetical protein
MKGVSIKPGRVISKFALAGILFNMGKCTKSCKRDSHKEDIYQMIENERYTQAKELFDKSFWLDRKDEEVQQYAKKIAEGIQRQEGRSNEQKAYENMLIKLQEGDIAGVKNEFEKMKASIHPSDVRHLLHRYNEDELITKSLGDRECLEASGMYTALHPQGKAYNKMLRRQFSCRFEDIIELLKKDGAYHIIASELKRIEITAKAHNKRIPEIVPSNLGTLVEHYLNNHEDNTSLQPGDNVRVQPNNNAADFFEAKYISERQRLVGNQRTGIVVGTPERTVVDIQFPEIKELPWKGEWEFLKRYDASNIVRYQDSEVKKIFAFSDDQKQLLRGYVQSIRGILNGENK